MDNLSDIAWLVLALVAAVAMVFVVRARRRGHVASLRELAEGNVCEHLRPALEMLLSRGHRVVRVGQKLPEMPMEIHVEPGFDPGEVVRELGLKDPVFVSEGRGVLFCKEDWCEVHPKGEIRMTKPE